MNDKEEIKRLNREVKYLEDKLNIALKDYDKYFQRWEKLKEQIKRFLEDSEIYGPERDAYDFVDDIIFDLELEDEEEEEKNNSGF